MIFSRVQEDFIDSDAFILYDHKTVLYYIGSMRNDSYKYGLLKNIWEVIKQFTAHKTTLLI